MIYHDGGNDDDDDEVLLMLAPICTYIRTYSPTSYLVVKRKHHCRCSCVKDVEEEFVNYNTMREE